MKMDGVAIPELRKRIDDALLALDARLCERARKAKLPRSKLQIVALSGPELSAVLAAFGQDARLWNEFQRLISQPSELVFDDVYAEALQAERTRPEPRSLKHGRADDSDYRNAQGWAKRINSLAGEAVLDALTLYAVAYVLGTNVSIRKQFQAAALSARTP
jgi:hypothetical protein